MATETPDILPLLISVFIIDKDDEARTFLKNHCFSLSESDDTLVVYQVTSFKNPEAARKILLDYKEKVDVILMGTHMPEIDGYEFLPYVKDNSIDVPVIFMSEDSALLSQAKAFKMGAFGYWIKPLTPMIVSEMQSRLFVHLSKRREEKRKPNPLLPYLNP